MKLELSHDILAKRIYDKISAEDKMRLKIRQLLTDRIAFYEEHRVLLSQMDLNYISSFLDQMELTTKESALINNSKTKIARQKKVRYAVVLLVAFLLVVLNYQFLEEEWNHLSKRSTQEDDYLAAEAADSAKTAEVARADTMLQKLGVENDPYFVQNLLASYDTLVQTQKALEQERNIAQSATLSNLAQLSIKKNKDYAFQLAAKSWKLNHDNRQACDLLYTIGDDAYDHEKHNIAHKDTAAHNNHIRLLIKQIAATRGEFDDKYLSVIMNNHSAILEDEEIDILQKVKELYVESPKEF